MSIEMDGPKLDPWKATKHGVDPGYGGNSRTAARPPKIQAQSLEDVAPEGFEKGFANISGIHPSISRSIAQRVGRLLKSESEFKSYVMRARMQHLMIQDYMARNAPESEDRNS